MGNGTFGADENCGRKPGRMSLQNKVTGKLMKPIKMLITGEGGTGKTTTACGAGNAIMLDVEHGSDRQDIERFPAVETWKDCIDAVKVLQQQEHTYKSLIIDTVDAAETLCQSEICRINGWASIEAPGYGRGYKHVAEEINSWLADLNTLRISKKINIIMIAHTQIATMSNPDGTDYARHAIKLHKKIASQIYEWCDIVAYIAREPIVTAEKNKAIGVRHIMRFQPGPTWEAKSRYDMPEYINMPENPAENWKIFEDKFKKGLK